MVEGDGAAASSYVAAPAQVGALLEARRISIALVGMRRDEWPLARRRRPSTWVCLLSQEAAGALAAEASCGAAKPGIKSRAFCATIDISPE